MGCCEPLSTCFTLLHWSSVYSIMMWQNALQYVVQLRLLPADWCWWIVMEAGWIPMTMIKHSAVSWKYCPATIITQWEHLDFASFYRFLPVSFYLLAPTTTHNHAHCPLLNSESSSRGMQVCSLFPTDRLSVRPSVFCNRLMASHCAGWGSQRGQDGGTGLTVDCPIAVDLFLLRCTKLAGLRGCSAYFNA